MPIFPDMPEHCHSLNVTQSPFLKKIIEAGIDGSGDLTVEWNDLPEIYDSSKTHAARATYAKQNNFIFYGYGKTPELAVEDICNRFGQRFKPAKAVKDESGHWYVIPAEMADVFDAELENEGMVDSGEFDAKWRKYMTGGDLNLTQLYANFKN